MSVDISEVIDFLLTCDRPDYVEAIDAIRAALTETQAKLAASEARVGELAALHCRYRSLRNYSPPNALDILDELDAVRDALLAKGAP